MIDTKQIHSLGAYRLSYYFGEGPNESICFYEIVRIFKKQMYTLILGDGYTYKDTDFNEKKPRVRLAFERLYGSGWHLFRNTYCLRHRHYFKSSKRREGTLVVCSTNTNLSLKYIPRSVCSLTISNGVKIVSSVANVRKITYIDYKGYRCEVINPRPIPFFCMGY